MHRNELTSAPAGAKSRAKPPDQTCSRLCYAVRMKFVTIRELRNRPGKVWEELRREDLVLTANGKPVGILVGVQEEGLDEALTSLRRARAQMAISRLRRQSAASGVRDLPAREIEREIRAVRRRRSR